MQFLLVDDHALIVTALKALLSAKFPDAVIHTGACAEDARRLAAEYGNDTDLMILDLILPGTSTATSLLEELVTAENAMKILVLSGAVDQRNILKVLQLGAAGFVPKTLDAEMLTAAIDFVLKGGVYIPSKLLTSSQQAGIVTAAETEMPASDVHLTERQKDVLECLSRGLPIKRICRELNLSEGTVKTHVSAIYRAFGATNRTEALIAARKAFYLN